MPFDEQWKKSSYCILNFTKFWATCRAFFVWHNNSLCYKKIYTFKGPKALLLSIIYRGLTNAGAAYHDTNEKPSSWAATRQRLILTLETMASSRVTVNFSYRFKKNTQKEILTRICYPVHRYIGGESISPAKKIHGCNLILINHAGNFSYRF